MSGDELSPVPVLPEAPRSGDLPVSKMGAPIATKMLYEDEAVRIWEHRLPPRTASAHHSHEFDYWLMTKHGADGMVVYRKNKLVGPAQKRGNTVGARGNLFFALAGAQDEVAENQGDHEALQYNCELKVEGGIHRVGQFPQEILDRYAADLAVASQVRLIYEDADLRIWDQRARPGETATVPVEHDCWQLDITGHRESAPAAMGAEMKPHGMQLLGVAGKKKYGTSFWQPKGTPGAATAKNIGSTVYRGIVVEAKGADPFAAPPAKL